MDQQTLLLAILAVAAMILSSAVHEWAHAFTAYKLGDDTAEREGRLTLNPVSHIDPIGTLLMPAIGAYFGFIFGYAKPVPFNASRFTRSISARTGVILVASAGPVSNLILAVLCAALLKALVVGVGGVSALAEPGTAQAFGMLLAVGIWLNVVLAVFNLLPIPPLDGHKVLSSVLRPGHPFIRFVENYQLFALLFVFFIGVRFLSGPITSIVRALIRVFELGGVWGHVWP